eukprot:CAMPEP_0194138854 /NCGR_PEP_ID=MMETSP0152-20130528/8598_1 /TAXON_ID=1049557 /ORGANISM="Thalassiothrix antarctica, Strain L6-D1" /LENGTH=808 /DNA_ID=CAMNT_0038836473 /DNA_START=583 /DNA_END=3005 /DNA_ORIENTATION=-
MAVKERVKKLGLDNNNTLSTELEKSKDNDQVLNQDGIDKDFGSSERLSREFTTDQVLNQSATEKEFGSSDRSREFINDQGLKQNGTGKDLESSERSREFKNDQVTKQNGAEKDFGSSERSSREFNKDKSRRKTHVNKDLSNIKLYRELKKKKSQNNPIGNNCLEATYGGRTRAQMQAERSRRGGLENMEEGSETQSAVDSEEEEEMLAHSILNLQKANAAMTDNNNPTNVEENNRRRSSLFRRSKTQDNVLRQDNTEENNRHKSNPFRRSMTQGNVLGQENDNSGRSSLSGSNEDVKAEEPLEKPERNKLKRIFMSSKKESIYLEEEKENTDHSEQMGFMDDSNASKKSLLKGVSEKFSTLKTDLLQNSTQKNETDACREAFDDVSVGKTSGEKTTTLSRMKLLIIFIFLAILALAISIPLVFKAEKRNNLRTNSPANFQTFAPTTQLPYVQYNVETDGKLNSYNEVAYLEGQDIGDEAARSLSMSPDGGFVAVGYTQKSVGPGKVQVYDITDGEFVQLGDPIVGEEIGDMFGHSVSLSSGGEIVAIGAPAASNDSGYAIVYSFNRALALWERVGNVIKPSILNGYTGGSISLSSDGSRLVVGIPRANSNNGAAIIYEYDFVQDLWKTLGQGIKGYSGELLGYSVSLNKNGDRVAIGAVSTMGSDSQQQGSVYVYHYANEWKELGSSLTGPDEFGRSVSLSADGNRVAVGSPGFDEGSISKVGVCEVYEYSEDWKQIGSKLKGQNSKERNGYSVILSGNGKRLGCGGNEESIVRIYESMDSDWKQIEEIIPSIPLTEFGTALGMNENG